MAIRIGRRTALRLPLLGLPVLGLAGTGAAGVLAGCGGPAWDEIDGRSVVIATGNRGGVFDRYGEALAQVLADRLPGVAVSTRRTDASVENVRLVSTGEATLGLALADTAADGVRGTGVFGQPLPLAALARTYDSFVHLVVRAGSGIEDLVDLRRRRVGLGAPGSGARVLATRLLEVAGVEVEDLRAGEESLQVAAQRLRAERLDAFFFVSGIPNSTVAALADELPVRLVDLDRWVPTMVERFGPEYVPGPVPATTYGLDSGTRTLSVKNVVLADPGMPEDLGYALTRVLFEAQDEVDAIAPGVPQPVVTAAPFTTPVPLHPGAISYFRETQS